MLSDQSIKHRALMMGIYTGDMPDVDFIWAVQKFEEGKMCFGMGYGCREKDCRWRNKCLALDLYDKIRLPVYDV